MNLSADHHDVVVQGARAVSDEVRDKYFSDVANALRELDPAAITERQLRRIIHAAVRRCQQEDASCAA